MVLVLGTLINQFRSSREGAILFQQQTAKAFATIRVAGGFAIEFIRNKFIQVESSMANFSLGITKAQKELKQIFTTGSDSEKLKKEILAIDFLINENEKSSQKAKEALDDLYDRDLTEEISAATKAASALVEQQFLLGDATKKANIEIAKQAAA